LNTHYDNVDSIQWEHVDYDFFKETLSDIWILDLNDPNNITYELLLDLSEEDYFQTHSWDLLPANKCIIQNGIDIVLLCHRKCIHIQIDPNTSKKVQVRYDEGIEECSEIKMNGDNIIISFKFITTNKLFCIGYSELRK